MMSEKEYLRYYSSDKYKQYDKKVIRFIAQILFDKRNQTDNIRQFFRSGYCFYFACILQIAFKRGKICLAEPFGHIVWVDDNGPAYDIEGPYIPEDNECDRLTDISFLGEAIIDFMHVPGKYYHAPKKLHKWAKSQNMTDIYALTSLFRDMPKEKIDYQKNITFNVYQYWKENVMG